MRAKFYSRMKTEVFEYIKKHEMLRQGDRVIIGVSGGPDSVCLLFLLHEIALGSKLELEVVHVNHMLRQEADEEEEFVRALCENLGIKFHCAKADVKKYAEETGLSTEEAGRIIRYDAFNKILGDKGGKIAVAHNMNDLAETVLFNLFRGAGLRGLGGIEPVKGNVIRPLLCAKRSDIIDYLTKNHIRYVTDQSNLGDDYTRNRIRHHILEYAEENIVNGSVANIAGAAERISEAEVYIRSQTVKTAAQCAVEEGDDILIDCERLIKEDPFIAKCVIYEMIGMHAGSKKDITSGHVNNVYELLFKEGSKETDLPYGIKAKKVYNRLFFESTGIQKEDETDIGNGDAGSKEGEDRLKLSGYKEVARRILDEFDAENIPRNNYTKWFDYDKITNACVWRCRREGDYLTVNSDMGRKSLQDYMVNEKVPKYERDNIPVLADGSHIMWVLGHRISEYYKVTKDTKRVLEIKVKKN